MVVIEIQHEIMKLLFLVKVSTRCSSSPQDKRRTAIIIAQTATYSTNMVRPRTIVMENNQL